MSKSPDARRMEKIVSLCKRRGFIFQSSEIYGGLNGCWDYGPLGVELKRNLKNYWWRVMVHERDDVVGMDGSILMNRAVWKASGHQDTFSDPMVDCRSCKARLRADQVIERKGAQQCPNCGGKDLSELKRNLKNYWWRVMVHERDDVVGMDGSILMNRAVWKASGHQDTFSDPMVDCRSCKARLRADQVIERKGAQQCPNCGGKDLTEP